MRILFGIIFFSLIFVFVVVTHNVLLGVKSVNYSEVKLMKDGGIEFSDFEDQSFIQFEEVEYVASLWKDSIFYNYSDPNKTVMNIIRDDSLGEFIVILDSANYRKAIADADFNDANRMFISFETTKPILLFTVMLVGMFFNQLFEIIQTQKNQGNNTISIKKTIVYGAKGIDFWSALVVSPIVYYASYYLVNSVPDDNTTAFFYSFQNGFFWQYVFKSLR